MSVQEQLSKFAADNQKISMEIAKLEAKKVGKGKAATLEIEKKITAERRKQVNLEA